MRRFANLRIVHKLALGFGTLLLIMVAVGGIAVRGAFRASRDLEVLYRREMASVVDIRRAQAESIRMGRCTRHALLDPTDKTVATELSHVDKSDDQVRMLLDRIESRTASPDERAL